MIGVGERIKELRRRAGLSQGQLSVEMGIRRVTLSKIENGERKISVEEIIKLSAVFGLTVEQVIDSEKEPEVVVLGEQGSVEETEESLRVSVPQENVKKFRNVLLYILNRIGSKPNIGQTVIYKLLYFIDFDYFEKYEEQLIGAKYMKNHFGPTPIEFEKIVTGMMEENLIEKVNSKHFSYPQTKYLPLVTADLKGFTALEMEVINSVIDRLSDMNAKQISDYSHKDVPWLTTEDQQVIEYDSVFYRSEEYSVREYDE